MSGIIGNKPLPMLPHSIDLLTNEPSEPVLIPELTLKIEKVEDEDGNVFGVLDIPYLIYIKPEEQTPVITINGTDINFGGYIDTALYETLPETTNFILSNACMYDPLELYKQANLGNVDLVNSPNLIWLHEEWTKLEDAVAIIKNFWTFMEVNTYSKFGFNQVPNYYDIGDIKSSLAPPELLKETGWIKLEEGLEIKKSEYKDLYNYLNQIVTPFELYPDKIIMRNIETFISMATEGNLGRYLEYQWKAHIHTDSLGQHSHKISWYSHENGLDSCNVANKNRTWFDLRDRQAVRFADISRSSSDGISGFSNITTTTFTTSQSGTGNEFRPDYNDLPFYIMSKNISGKEIQEVELVLIKKGTQYIEEWDE